jgi:hypothetical protein
MTVTVEILLWQIWLFIVTVTLVRTYSRFQVHEVHSQLYCVVLICRVRRCQILDNLLIDREFLDDTSPRIYPWNQSKIENRKSKIE